MNKFFGVLALAAILIAPGCINWCKKSCGQSCGPCTTEQGEKKVVKKKKKDVAVVYTGKE